MRLFIITLLVSLGLNLQSQSLSSYKWKNRLIVFVGEMNKENQKRLEAYNGSIPDLKERKLIFLHLTNTTVSELLPNAKPILQDIESYQFLKKKHPERSIFLIGLDGGIKQKTDILFQPEELFKIIDAMPMRASEIRRKNE